jgi:hypothetical protein
MKVKRERNAERWLPLASRFNPSDANLLPRLRLRVSFESKTTPKAKALRYYKARRSLRSFDPQTADLRVVFDGRARPDLFDNSYSY